MGFDVIEQVQASWTCLVRYDVSVPLSSDGLIDFAFINCAFALLASMRLDRLSHDVYIKRWCFVIFAVTCAHIVGKLGNGIQ